ncbi:hypothetical protein FGG08_003934 [Glutinoglossum americanum]|uniref:Uncharacterized protein n=1 Tax=Glutinoglossum americanum TaxID=1670608 RepID=A0A9P8I3B0_9PEZI|nr:hypothetical protein FGG08_003934 [Glutinoglossum americanum]
MPPKKPTKSSKPSTLDVVSSYDLRKVHIPYIGENGTSSYQPRSAPKKAAVLRESLLTLAKQKQQQRQQARHQTRSAGPAAPGSLTSNQPRQRMSPPKKPQRTQTTSQNVSQSTNQQRMGTHRQGPIQWLVMEEEEEEEEGEEGEEEEGEGEDEDENEDLQLAQDVLKASNKFKNYRMRQTLQKVTNDVRSAYPDDLTTSDVQDHLEDIVENTQLRVDYPIELYIKIYINKVLMKRKSLPDTTRDNFDLSDIENNLAQDLNGLGNSEPISILQRTAFVHAATRKTAQKVHDLNDFGLIEANRILEMVEAAREQHPRSKIALTVEIRASTTTLASKPHPPKRKALEIDEEASSPIPSSPPIVQEKKKKCRTSILEAQQAVRLDRIQLAGDFERQLVDRLVCKDKDCTNQDNFCWPDPMNPKSHFAVTAPQQKSWAQAISTGDATLSAPPIKIYNYWQTTQGAITRESRAPVRRTFQQETAAALGSMKERIEQAQLQNLLATEQDRAAQRMEREEDRRFRREEQEEECWVRREEQEEERRRRKEVDDRVRQQRSEEEIRKHTWTQLPPQYNVQHPLHNHASFPHPTMVPGLYNSGSKPQLSEIYPVARKSSPISGILDDWQILGRFFDFKVHRQLQEVVDKWERIRRIVNDQDWTIADLKEMEDGKSAMYQRALAVGISDGFARYFASELKAFKRIHQVEEKAAQLLAGHVGG